MSDMTVKTLVPESLQQLRVEASEYYRRRSTAESIRTAGIFRRMSRVPSTASGGGSPRNVRGRRGTVVPKTLEVAPLNFLSVSKIHGRITKWVDAAKIKTDNVRVAKNAKSLGIVTELDDSQNPDDIVWWMQGDESQYSQDALKKREFLRQAPEVNECIKDYWVMFDGNKDGTICKEEYLFCNLVVYKVLMQLNDCPYSEEEALEAVEVDWDADRRGKDALSYRMFHSSMFELVDNWTKTTDLEEYTSFLRTLYAFTSPEITRMREDMEKLNQTKETISQAVDIKQNKESLGKLMSMLRFISDPVDFSGHGADCECAECKEKYRVLVHNHGPDCPCIECHEKYRALSPKVGFMEHLPDCQWYYLCKICIEGNQIDSVAAGSEECQAKRDDTEVKHLVDKIRKQSQSQHPRGCGCHECFLKRNAKKQKELTAHHTDDCLCIACRNKDYTPRSQGENLYKAVTGLGPEEVGIFIITHLDNSKITDFKLNEKNKKRYGVSRVKNNFAALNMVEPPEENVLISEYDPLQEDYRPETAKFPYPWPQNPGSPSRQLQSGHSPRSPRLSPRAPTKGSVPFNGRMNTAGSRPAGPRAAKLNVGASEANPGAVHFHERGTGRKLAPQGVTSVVAAKNQESSRGTRVALSKQQLAGLRAAQSTYAGVSPRSSARKVQG